MHRIESHPIGRLAHFVLLMLFVLLGCPAFTHGVEPSPDAAEKVDFARDIRPIISENCVFCHGPDEATRKADLRLDTASGVDSVVEKHASDDSEMLRRLISDDPDEMMPPRESNRSLETHQIELIRRWIDQGAAWETHWSFRPLRLPEIPPAESLNQGKEDAPLRNPIDHFVRRKLIKNGRTASPEASRATLVRRLSLDLTGLPPTPQEVNAFLADTSKDAYEKLVDRLLDSPAYGQRMAWNWLDAARYADTNGYQGDRERTMWPWRDWIVKAFNENLPYDQFTLWQLAGDLLPDATLEQKLATGFARNHMINGEGGRIAEENRVEYVMDMSETMGTVWLGLTLNCCRCHDHKYDPISNREYYQLFGFFNQTPVNGGGGDPQTAPNLAIPSEQQTAELESLGQQLKQIDQQTKELSRKISADQPAWETSKLSSLETKPLWQTLIPQEAKATGSVLTLLPDHSILTSGPAPDNDTYTIVANTQQKQITGIRIDALRHESFPGNSLSYSDSGNFVLTEIEISQVTPEQNETAAIKISSADATFEQNSLGVTNAFDGNRKTGWAVYEGRRVDRDHAAVFRFENPVAVIPGQQLRIVLRHDSPHKQHNLGRFRLSLSERPEPKLEKGKQDLLIALQTSAEKRNEQQQKLVASSHQDSVPEFKILATKRAKLIKQRDDITRSFPKVMVMADMEKPRQTFVLTRGLYNKPTDEVKAGFPGFLPGPAKANAEQTLDRLALARWLIDAKNPLTARVTVNRFWQQVFGIGLVKTTEDFGAQGETPEQMDLLNWLAKTFQQDGWNVKNLLRTIVTSHTYRQSSIIDNPATYERDPDNRLLARAPRHRLPAWMLRDQALAASGLLSPVIGGPSVNTYQPKGVWEEASFGKKKYRQDTGEKLYRRSLYTYWRRIISPTMFFDSASRQTCTVKASRTNTPLHALQTLNNTTYVEAARVLAQNVLLQESDSDKIDSDKIDSDKIDSDKIDAARIDRIMHRVLARAASEPERQILLRGLNRTRHQFADGSTDALALISVGESAWDKTLDPTELAAWANLCLAVLNLDETLNRE